MSYLPTVSESNQKIIDYKNAQEQKYMKENCDAIAAGLFAPPCGNPPSIGLIAICVSGPNAWKDSYDFLDKCNNEILHELKRRGFTVSLSQRTGSSRFPNLSIIFHNLLSGESEMPPHGTQDDMAVPLPANVTLSNVRSNIAAGIKRGTADLRKLLTDAFNANKGDSRSIVVDLTKNGWAAYAAPNEKIVIERERPGYTVFVDRTRMAISW